MAKNNLEQDKSLDEDYKPAQTDTLDQLDNTTDTDNLDPEQLQEGEFIICPGCGEKMPKTIHTCVTCGQKLKHSTYEPISEKKAAKIRMIVGVVLLIVFFVVWFAVLAD